MSAATSSHSFDASIGSPWKDSITVRTSSTSTITGTSDKNAASTANSSDTVICRWAG